MASARMSDPPLRVVVLFSGLSGWTAPFRDHGHVVFSIDISDVEAVLGAVPWRPDIVFASPPCSSFSTMTMGRMWTHDGEPKHPLAVEGRQLVLATLRIIAVLQPTFWTIENPRARLRTLDLPAGIPRATISQCQYGTGRQKMTDLFGVLPPSLVLEPPCRNGDPCHVPAPRGSRTGTQGGLSGVEAAMIPMPSRMPFASPWSTRMASAGGRHERRSLRVLRPSARRTVPS